MTTRDPNEFQWALPAGMEVPADPLRVRLDIYDESILMHLFEGDGTAEVRMVSPTDIARALATDLTSTSPLLPESAIMWAQSRHGDLILMYRPPQKTRLALAKELGQPPKRFNIPMPPLLFAVNPGAVSPWVYAVKGRPQSLEAPIFKAPCWNVFASGRVCPGTHTFPRDPALVPDSFFQSLFSRSGDNAERSRKYPDLEARWDALAKARRYPLTDLAPMYDGPKPMTLGALMSAEGPLLRRDSRW